MEITDPRVPHPGTEVHALVPRLAATPAITVNHVGDILSTNVLAQELFSEFSIRDNLIRMIFLDAAATCCPDAWRAHA
ncbi:transcriptional regulator, partial [Mycobacterium sp. ITM-2017-0098]